MQNSVNYTHQNADQNLLESPQSEYCTDDMSNLACTSSDNASAASSCLNSLSKLSKDWRQRLHTSITNARFSMNSYFYLVYKLMFFS